jgi:uncharacterized LabA/DUF88 family protein
MDILIASDLVYHAARKTFDTAIVVTEDGIYSSTLENVKDLGCHVEIATFQDNQNRELIRVADIRIPLDSVLNQYSSKIFPPDLDDNLGNTVERVGRVQKSFTK